MELTPESVAAERDWVRQQAAVVVPLINEVRARLAEAFDAEVSTVGADAYRAEVDAVFADGDTAVNVAALVDLLRRLDVEADHPGFVVDELLGRRLAAFIAGGGALSVLAEATFHYADIHHHADGGAGSDDLEAGLAAGFQSRLPGWAWRDRPSPFGIEPADGRGDPR